MPQEGAGCRDSPAFAGIETASARPRGQGLTVAAADGEAIAIIATPAGPFVLKVRDGVITSQGFEPTAVPSEPSGNATLVGAVAQLRRYFHEPTAGFFLPLADSGTAFMRRVWSALAEIPPGRTETYGNLARRLGSGPRAVAAACRANPFAIVIPCHRVVSAGGLGGYCGQTTGPMLEIKRWLLRHEGHATR